MFIPSYCQPPELLGEFRDTLEVQVNRFHRCVALLPAMAAITKEKALAKLTRDRAELNAAMLTLNSEITRRGADVAPLRRQLPEVPSE